MLKSNRRIYWLLFIVATIVVAFGAILLDAPIQIDRCLDGGGSWNYENAE